MNIVYDIKNLVKQYPNQTKLANDHINLTIAEGEIFGLLGANGAGKSTLVKQMVNLLTSSSGEILFYNQPLHKDPIALSMQVGYMPQDSAALNQLTIREALYFTAHLRGLSRNDAKADREKVINLWGLRPFQNQTSTKLSGGQKRLFRLAVASAGRPPVLILDEPTNDLDPERRKQVWQVLQTLNEAHGITIIFITHDAIEAEKVIQRVGIMKDGKLIVNGRPADLKKQLNQKMRLELFFTERPPTLPPQLTKHIIDKNRWHLWVAPEEVSMVLGQLDLNQLDDFKLVSATLEDLYLHYATET
ncbi:MAG: ABC transporter ATP-binding protein [Chloroflexota bacterium]